MSNVPVITPRGRPLAPHVVHAITEYLTSHWKLACRNCEGMRHELWAAFALQLQTGEQWTEDDEEQDERQFALLVCEGCAETRLLDFLRAGIDPFAEPIEAHGDSPYR